MRYRRPRRGRPNIVAWEMTNIEHNNLVFGQHIGGRYLVDIYSGTTVVDSQFRTVGTDCRVFRANRKVSFLNHFLCRVKT
jgi:hypothetical protein